LLLTAASLSARPNQYRSLPLDRQNLGLLASERSTHSVDFVTLGGWGPSDSMHVNARGGIAATLSATVSGGPVEFRLFLEDIEKDWAVRPMKPRWARFDPGAGTASSSFTYVAAVHPGDYTVNISWRSPDGVQVTLHAMTLVVQYGQAV
jgi:hypothetical protein